MHFVINCNSQENERKKTLFLGCMKRLHIKRSQTRNTTLVFAKSTKPDSNIGMEMTNKSAKR